MARACRPGSPLSLLACHQHTRDLTITHNSGTIKPHLRRRAAHLLPEIWGLQGQGQPLHRLFNSILQGDNRTIICQDGSFTADQNITNALTPYKDNDSCDEFPFASTYESGAMVDDVNSNQKPFVTTGADCAQVTAVHTGTSGNNEAADWATTTVNGTPTLTEPCVRGHIPQALNSLVGTAYSTTITTNHLIDKDAFWLSVSP